MQLHEDVRSLINSHVPLGDILTAMKTSHAEFKEVWEGHDTRRISFDEAVDNLDRCYDRLIREATREHEKVLSKWGKRNNGRKTKHKSFSIEFLFLD